jgi:phenylpropionate dioxygenase-like ring-hydroxylating dioxygenase large terminal subunit
VHLHPPAAIERPAYPRDQWYVGALSSEIGHAPFARTLLSLPIVMYRNRAGRVLAAHGLCPHRGYPFASGTLVAGGLRCGYHGLTFDDDGACRALTSPDGALRMFATIERPPLVWVWTGAAQAADAGRIPATADLGIGSGDGRVDACGYLHVAARYRFLCDNVLDVAQISFIHNGTLERTRLHFSEARLDPDPARIIHARESRANPAAAFAFLLPDVRGPIDVVLTAEVRGPGLIIAVASEFYRTSSNGTPRTALAKMAFVHALTPETATSTHYFPLFTRNFRLTDEPLSRVMSARNALVAAEDKAVVETLETAAREFAALPGDFSLPEDALALRTRQLIATLVAAEANAGAG